jgi:hypothetical protein
MRARIQLIIEENLLAKVDVIAGDKIKRNALIVRGVTELIEREESKKKYSAAAKSSNEQATV